MTSSTAPRRAAWLGRAAFLAVALVPVASAQVDPILGADVQDHVDILASDLFEGRGAGTPGERRAAAYIVSVLEELDGVEPSGVEGWFQPFVVKHKGATDPEGDEARNILAVLPGSDPDLSHEVIVLGAHYDHVGHGRHGGSLGFKDPGNDDSGVPLEGPIHNGADDNASGSAALLELAAWFASADQRPRRTLAFQWYSGEELGLKGSEFYVGEPTLPLDDTIAMLNLDMVGRLTGSQLLVGGTGTSPIFSDLVSDLAGREDFLLIEDPPGAAPSDNTSFYERDIPVLFFFTGVHDDYHRPTDTSDLLDAEGAARIARLVRDVVLALDAADEPPPFTPAPGMAIPFRPMVDVGLSFDATRRGTPGIATIAVLVPDSPAGRVGLAEGDVVASLDGVTQLDLATLIERVEHADPDDGPITFTVWRALPDAPADAAWADAHELLEFVVQPTMRPYEPAGR